MEKEKKVRKFTPGSQMQATSNRPGLTRSEIYECISFDEEKGMVTIVNDDNKVHSYSSQCFRTMKDDFSKMFGIFDEEEKEDGEQEDENSKEENE